MGATHLDGLVVGTDGLTLTQSDGTELPVSADDVAEGQFLKRVGAVIVGASGGGGGSPAGAFGSVQFNDSGSFAGANLEITENTVETTDDTLTPLISIPLDDDSCYFIEVRTVGFQTAGAGGAGVGGVHANLAYATLKRTGGGPANLLDSKDNHVTYSDGSPSFAADVSVNNFVFEVQNEPNATVTWKTTAIATKFNST